MTLESGFLLCENFTEAARPASGMSAVQEQLRQQTLTPQRQAQQQPLQKRRDSLEDLAFAAALANPCNNRFFDLV